MRELGLPKEVASSETTIEIIRVWHDGGDVGFITLGDIWEDPGQIGILLADLMRHMVASSERTEAQKASDLSRAFQIFVSEIESPTQ